MQQQLQQHQQAAAAVHTNCVEGVFLLDGPFCHFFDDGCECFPFFVRYFTRLQTALKTTTKDKLFALLRQHNFVMIDFFCCFSFRFLTDVVDSSQTNFFLWGNSTISLFLFCDFLSFVTQKYQNPMQIPLTGIDFVPFVC